MKAVIPAVQMYKSVIPAYIKNIDVVIGTIKVRKIYVVADIKIFDAVSAVPVIFAV